MNKISLLIIEDEIAIRDMIRFSLPENEFHILDASDTEQAKKIISLTMPNLILLDWMLPCKSGLDFLRWIRQESHFKNIPVIMLSAKAEEVNKIAGLSCGADDYVTKPFSNAELIVRIKTILRRGPLVSTEGEIRVDDLILNVDQCKLTISGCELSLTPIEYKLMQFFVKNRNKTFSRDNLINHVWGMSIYIDDRTVDVQIKRLRHKLKPYSYHTRIKTIRNMGYLFS